MNATNTRELILDLQAGNHEALGELYDRFNKLVFRTALGIAGDPEVAADLMQEAFLRLYRFADRIEPDRPLEPWLARVTANLAYTWVRRRRWLQPLEDVTEWLAGEKKQAPHQIAETREEWQQIEYAIQSLPLPQRVVIALYYLGDYSLKEISDLLDVPEGTVKSRLHYGRDALKKFMSAQENYVIGMQYDFT
ncbi:MAG: RNA polymerase sigma factor [Anaerolineae bacterium]|nr:RNA polymerase sigma factor [Anaerolineae bacterium]